MSNQIVVSADHLAIIHEQVMLMSIDSSELALALQAVTTDCAVSGGVISAVIMALAGHADRSEDVSDQLSGILSAPHAEVADYE